MRRRSRSRLEALTALLAAALLAIAVVATGCTATGSTAEQPAESAAPAELTVSAAATLRKAFEQMQPEFEKASGAKLTFNFGASGVLLKQVEGGAPVDVFASASPAQIDTLTAEGFVSVESTSSFISNELVIVTPTGNPASVHGPEDLKKAARLATGNPESAPHGTKAKEWLTTIGLWDGLQSSFVFGENAAQTTDYVARGEVDAALVFASEAAGRQDMEVVYTVPADQIKPIRYVIAPLAKSQNPKLAEAFIEYVMSPAGQQVLLDNGFVALAAK